MMGLALSPANAVPLGQACLRVDTGRSDERYRHEFLDPPVLWEVEEEATSNLLVLGSEESGKTTLARGLLGHALAYPGSWRAHVVAGGHAALGEYGCGAAADALAGCATEEEDGVGLLRGVLHELEARLETAAGYAGRVSPMSGLRDLNGCLADEGRERLPRVLVVLDEPESVAVLALADELAHRGWHAGVHVAMLLRREETVPSRTLRAFGARLAFRWRMVRWSHEEWERKGLDPPPVVARLSEGGREPREIAVAGPPPEGPEGVLPGADEGATP